MAIGDVIVGIDITASKVCCCLGQINKFNQVEILSSASCDCDGFVKGKYEDIDSIARAIRFAISDIESKCEFLIKSAYVNIIGKYVDVFNTHYEIELEDKYAGVSQRNIDEIINGVGNIELPDDYQIIDIVPTKFITDTKVTLDPIGIFTKTLAADIDLILTKKQIVKQIALMMQKAGLQIDGIIVNGFTMKDLVLDKEEMQGGVLLLDAGNTSIDISVFKDNSILYCDSLPIGGDTITNDIALSLEISVEEAQKLKKQYGLADSEYIDHDYNIKLNTYNGESNENSIVKCSELVSIISARVNEIFDIIMYSLKDNNLLDKIKGVVVTGQGFNNINKVDRVAEKVLKTSVRFGNPKVANLVKPECINVFGEVKYISGIKHNKNIGSTVQVDDEQSFLDSTVKTIKRIFNNKKIKE